MATIPAHGRRHYLPIERLTILELRAARGWSQAQAAERMQITPATVAVWAPDGWRILGALGPLGAASALAVLLVGRCRRGPLHPFITCWGSRTCNKRDLCRSDVTSLCFDCEESRRERERALRRILLP